MKHFFILFLLSLSWIDGTANDTTQLRRPRVGLILSGGGAKGIAHVGVLKVIEETGLPIDYIGGTSMGSIVGGLYSIGYSANQLEKYILEKDWNALLTDKIPRRNVVIYEKGERKRYWLHFPITGRKINLPMGILSGQNVSNLFTELASPAYDQFDFSKFPIPFLCIATDIGTGEEVVLEHGQLSKAMRASMAIPSVFTPEPLDGKMLFDGGLVNNFPADKIKEKGIDILIGIDVTTQVQGDELNNIYLIMEQVVFMASVPLKEANKKLCKILIVPDIPEYGAGSFSAADSLIVRGERAARKHYGTLKALADSLNQLDPRRPLENSRDCPQPLENFYVKSIRINGLEHTSEQFILKKSELEFPAEMTFSELDEAADRLRGTQAFESVVYNVLPSNEDDESVELVFDIIERSTNLFRVGLHYDKEYKAALMLNLSFQNILLNNSRALADVSIGENPSFKLAYFQSPGVRPYGKSVFKSSLSPDWSFQIDGYKFEASEYSGNNRIGIFDFSHLVASLKMQITPSVNSMVGVGLIGDYTMIKSKLVDDRVTAKSNYMYLSYQLYYEQDTYNMDYFPTEGGFFRLEGNYHKGMSKNARYSEVLIGMIFRSNFASAPTRRWTIYSGLNAASVFGDDIPPQYQVYLGGLPDQLRRSEIRFPGLHFMQKSAKNGITVHFNNQVRLWSNIYFTFRTSLGKIDDDFIELFTPKDLMIGYGISAQYNSVVGPLGLTLSSSNVTNSLLGAFHVGFWF
ncbi:MAG: patatin-like phospholipase family protein [Bacteroidales bacterium]|nr:patatin-like phospholipase family protein [Bacteroidales bacterium]